MEPFLQIKLVLSDLDESLLSPDHMVGERSKVAIARLQAAGVTFSICTGRAPEATRAIVNQLGVRYYICNNGASVHDGDQILAQKVMPPEIADALTRFFVMRQVPVYLMTPEGYFLTHQTPATDKADRARGVAPTLLPPERWATPAHKVMAWGGAHTYEECLTQFGDRVHIIYNADYLEIAPHGISKQWGGAQLAQHLGLPASDVAAVGDGRNDIEMIQWAGIGAAMGNADPQLLAVADLILPHHAEDGTAQLFEAILSSFQG